VEHKLSKQRIILKGKEGSHLLVPILKEKKE